MEYRVRNGARGEGDLQTRRASIGLHESRADEAQKEASWANRRVRGSQTQLDLAPRGHRTLDQIEWQLSDLNFSILKELSPTLIASIIRQGFTRTTSIDADGKPVTVYTDRAPS